MLLHEQASANTVRHIVLGAEEMTDEQPRTVAFGARTNDPGFPEPLAQEAFYGVTGDIVQALEPHTEADPAALLVMTLAACGAVIGRAPHYVADGARHGVNLFACIVGDSSKARKGTAWARVKSIVTPAADDDFERRIEKGLSSGEGLISLVRDPAENDEDDAGVADKRLLIVQSEFSSPLKVMRREGNTLSVVIREAWDGERLRTATKNSPLVATDPHIAIIGHITREELARSISDTEASNGFGNRFLWVAARRSKCLPHGGNLDGQTVEILVSKLRDAFAFGRRNLRYHFDEPAAKAWENIYPELSEGKPGLLGAMINRAEGQVIRLAMLYAALDGSNGEIRAEHLKAALAVWEYCEHSARWVFGERLGDPVADTILEALASNSNGMTRTDIHNYLGRNAKAGCIPTALQFLHGHGKARCKREQVVEGLGRPVERWFAVTKETNLTK